MTVLVTGSAGFIGYHVSAALLARGEQVLGVDRLDGYYDPALKRARLERLQALPGFAFERADIADRAAHDRPRRGAARRDPERRPSRPRRPACAIRSRRRSTTCRAIRGPHGDARALPGELPELRHLVYASSSSVYGGNPKLPFAVGDRVDQPLSLYAATKRADELLSHCYSHLYQLPATGLRFFTVYGPWGRPDMAAFRFADAITAGQPITLYNQGEMERDFTYIDDVVAGVLAALDRPPAAGDRRRTGSTISAITARSSSGTSSRCSSRRSAGARRSAWRRCRPATWSGPRPTSRPAGATSASSRRRRSRRACRASPPGTATITAAEARQGKVDGRKINALRAIHDRDRRGRGAPCRELCLSVKKWGSPRPFQCEVEQGLAQVLDRLLDLVEVAGAHGPHQGSGSGSPAFLAFGEVQKIVRSGRALLLCRAEATLAAQGGANPMATHPPKSTGFRCLNSATLRPPFLRLPDPLPAG